MTRLLTLLVALLAAPSLAGAGPGKFNKVLAPGDAAPAWEGLEGTDGKKHALADLKDKEVVVVVFTCNSCPVAKDYEDRIVALAAAHAGPDAKVAVVAINVNTGRDDALPAMRVRAEKKKFPFAYLFDPTQEIARRYGATYTPEFFVLGRDRTVLYAGALDDKSPPEEPSTRYVEAAVAAALAGKKVEAAETSAAAGCRIKFNPKKDD
ncbi:thioredoxin family protein [Gemmata sp.]|uniref:thioredoxin family protein n=1 Tax=Gemmata sp. TaxID=1914242 RepID=UPI003F731011